MPRKKRDIRNDYRALGFSERSAKHSEGKIFFHSLVREHFLVSGHDRDDAKPYDEVDLRRARRLLEEGKQRGRPV